MGASESEQEPNTIPAEVPEQSGCGRRQNGWGCQAAPVAARSGQLLPEQVQKGQLS